MKRVVIFLMLVIFILGITFFAYVLRKDAVKKEPSTTIDFSGFHIEKRTKLFVNDELLIGQNIKELENGYYDFKLASKEDTAIITLNKLWYEEYGLDYIQDEYLAKICREIVKSIVTYSEKEELEYQLYKYIKDNYIKAKEGYDVEKLELDGISIWAKSNKSECVVYLKVE